MADARGGIGQQRRPGPRATRARRPAGRVVRAVHEDSPGSRPDRGRDAVEVEVEGRWLELDAHRLAAGSEDQDLVEEPRRREEDDLVAGLDEGRAARPRSAAKPPFVIATSRGSQSRPVRAVSVAATVRCEAGSLTACRRTSPCPAARRGAASASTYAGERHLLRVADGEVRDVGLGVELRERPTEELQEGRNALAEALGGRCGGRHRGSLFRGSGKFGARLAPAFADLSAQIGLRAVSRAV